MDPLHDMPLRARDYWLGDERLHDAHVRARDRWLLNQRLIEDGIFNAHVRVWMRHTLYNAHVLRRLALLDKARYWPHDAHVKTWEQWILLEEARRATNGIRVLH